MSTEMPWSRFEQEDAAWSSFSEYLHLAVPRPTVTEFARSCRAKPADVLRWSLEWYWDARVEEYDVWASHASMRRTYPVSHPLILSVMRMCLSELRKYEVSQAKVPDAGYFTVEQCLKMLREIRAAERDISRLQKEQDEAVKTGALVPDFSKLSLDDQRTLDALLQKVTQR